MTVAGGAPGTAADGYRAGVVVAGDDVVERVARAICDSDYETVGTSWAKLDDYERGLYRRLAAAAIAAMPASPAEEALQLDPICSDCEDHGDGSYTCDPDRPGCPSGIERRAKVLLAPARVEIANIRAALAPPAGEAGR